MENKSVTIDIKLINDIAHYPNAVKGKLHPHVEDTIEVIRIAADMFASVVHYREGPSEVTLTNGKTYWVRRGQAAVLECAKMIYLQRMMGDGSYRTSSVLGQAKIHENGELEIHNG